MLLLLTQVVSFRDIYVFLQLTHCIFTHQSWRKYFFEKLTQFSQGNNVLDATASTTNGFLLRETCFINLAEYPYLEQREPISTLKNTSGQKNSFQKLTQLSQGNNVLGASASNTYGFLSRDTVFLQLSLIGLFVANRAYIHLEKPKA
jgi:hypothetical protein